MQNQEDYNEYSNILYYRLDPRVTTATWKGYQNAIIEYAEESGLKIIET